MRLPMPTVLRVDGFRAHELGRLRELVVQHHDILWSRWHEHHGD
jgi:hypothetical protein